MVLFIENWSNSQFEQRPTYEPDTMWLKILQPILTRRFKSWISVDSVDRDKFRGSLIYGQFMAPFDLF